MRRLNLLLNPRWLALLLLLTSSIAVTAADDFDELSYMTLNGLSVVAIQVDGIHKGFSPYGLNAETVVIETANVLRENGIRVVDLVSAKNEPNAALMRIKLTANENQYRFYFYGISIELRQKIPLNNPAGGYISGTIWKEGKTGTIMPMDLREMNNHIAGLLDSFLKDFHNQNPRQLSSTR